MIFPVMNFNNLFIPASQVNFEGRKFIPAKEIKNLHMLTCPRCGGPIIEPQLPVEAYRSISRPLRIMLKKGFLDESKKRPEIWAVLNKFAEETPNSSLDKILENEEKHTILRRAIEKSIAPDADLNDAEVYKSYNYIFDKIENGIRKSARRELRSSGVVMRKLKQFLPYLKEIEQKEPFKNQIRAKIGAFEELIYYSNKYPNKTLSEIINMPGHVKFFTSMKEGLEKDFRHKKSLYFTEIQELLKNNLDCSEEELSKFRNKLVYVFLGSDEDPGFRKYNALNLVRVFLERKHGEELYEQVEKILEKVPEANYNKYTELCHCIGETNDAKIVDSIIKPYVGSSEHLTALSSGGEDKRDNIMSMHKDCNERRSNKPYTKYIQIYPEVPNNIYKQIREVSEQVYKDRMISYVYNLYPLYVSNELRRITHGLITPNVEEYRLKAMKKSLARIRANEAKIRQISIQRDKALVEIVKGNDTPELREQAEVLSKELRETIYKQENERSVYARLRKFSMEWSPTES